MQLVWDQLHWFVVKKGWQIWQRFCAAIYRMSFLALRHLCTPSLSLSLALCLSLSLYVCAASCGLCLGAATLFNGKKFTLPLASRKLCPRMGKAYVVVPFASLVAVAYSHAPSLSLPLSPPLCYCCCFCQNFCANRGNVFAACAAQTKAKQTADNKEGNKWLAEGSAT